MKEIWKDIKDFEGLYQVSNLGRVKSLYFNKEKILKVSYNKGYLIADLYKNKKRYKRPIHILVAQTFIENPNNYKEVLHLDETRNNNCVDNLKWGTHKENTNMPLYKNRQSIAHKGLLKGEKHPMYRKEQPKELKEKWSISHKGNKSKSKKVICNNIIFNSIKECAYFYNIKPNTMHQWLNNKNKMPEFFQNLGLRIIKEKIQIEKD